MSTQPKDPDGIERAESWFSLTNWRMWLIAAGFFCAFKIAFATLGSADPAKPIVDRGFFGCPGGYVDHPSDPKKCVVPAVAERVYRRRG